MVDAIQGGCGLLGVRGIQVGSDISRLVHCMGSGVASERAKIRSVPDVHLYGTGSLVSQRGTPTG